MSGPLQLIAEALQQALREWKERGPSKESTQDGQSLTETCLARGKVADATPLNKSEQRKSEPSVERMILTFRVHSTRQLLPVLVQETLGKLPPTFAMGLPCW